MIMDLSLKIERTEIDLVSKTTGARCYLSQPAMRWSTSRQLRPTIMVVLDGASDRPNNQRTPLEAATTPNLDALTRRGGLGSMFTVGRGIAPESDAGVFSLLGYDPLAIHLSRGV